MEHQDDCTCDEELSAELVKLLVTLGLALHHADQTSVKTLRKCGLDRMAYDTQELIHYKSPCTCATEDGTCQPCLARENFKPCPLHFTTGYGCPTCGPYIPTKQEVH